MTSPGQQRRVVSKVGSAQLIDPATSGARTDRFAAIAADVAASRARGDEVVIVSSGVVGLGRQRLGLAAGKVLTLAEKQAAAAAWQSGLVGQWNRALQGHGWLAAQTPLIAATDELRLDSEMGIATRSLHLHGPVGAGRLSASKTLVTGEGQVRGSWPR